METRNLKDILHLYLGCDWQWNRYAGDYADGIYGTNISNSGLLKEVALKNGVAKPILRPLSDMTEEEIITLVYKKSNSYLNVKPSEWHYGSIYFEFEYKSSTRRRKERQSMDELNPDQFIYLLKQGFDLFGLIESGLAINKSTL